MNTIRLTMGYDRQKDGSTRTCVGYQITEADGTLLNQESWFSSGPKATQPGPDDWMRLLRRHCTLPRVLRKAGLGWEDGQVAPKGYSQGSGHAPEGIEIKWELT